MQGPVDLSTESKEENHFPADLTPGDWLKLIFCHLLDEMNILPTMMKSRYFQHTAQSSPLTITELKRIPC